MKLQTILLGRYKPFIVAEISTEAKNRQVISFIFEHMNGSKVVVEDYRLPAGKHLDSDEVEKLGLQLFKGEIEAYLSELTV